MKHPWKAALWLFALACTPAHLLAANQRLVIEPAPYQSVVDDENAPPILDGINAMLLAYIGRNGSWNAEQFLREYVILDDRGDVPTLWPDQRLNALQPDAAALMHAVRAFNDAKGVLEKREAMQALGLALDQRVEQIEERNTFLLPQRPFVDSYSEAKAGFRFRPGHLLGWAGNMRAGVLLPALGAEHGRTALLLTNLSTGRLPVEEFGVGMVGLLDLTFLPASSEEEIAAFERVENPHMFAEVRVHSPWKSFPAPVSKGPLQGAIGKVETVLVREVRTDSTGRVVYAATLKSLQKLPEPTKSSTSPN